MTASTVQTSNPSDYAITAIDEAFFPGLVALHNSIRINSPSTRLACMTYGSDELARRVESLGIEVHHNAEINCYLPPGDGTEENCSPMYARLLAPDLYERCVWLDADQIVTGDLSELFRLRLKQPVAAVQCPSGTRRSVSGIDVPESDAIYSGLMVLNAPVWKQLRVTERCLDMMRNPGKARFKYVVQSVLNVVLGGNFYHLDAKWQGFANRTDFKLRNHRVVHWHGRGDKPWDSDSVPNSGLWRQYA